MTSAHLQPGPLMLRTLAREQCVLFFRALVHRGVGKEEAMARAAEACQFRASITSVRRWNRAYNRAGFLGLTEAKRGRVAGKAAGRTK